MKSAVSGGISNQRYITGLLEVYHQGYIRGYITGLSGGLLGGISDDIRTLRVYSKSINQWYIRGYITGLLDVYQEYTRVYQLVYQVVYQVVYQRIHYGSIRWSIRIRWYKGCLMSIEDISEQFTRNLHYCYFYKFCNGNL